MQIISREAIPSIHKVLVDGHEHDLGTVKALASSPELAKFLPAQSDAAMSWVRLEGDQELAPHRHDESGLILVAEGTGMTLGDCERPLVAGDMVLVPPGALHGFRGTGNGFWALTVQFKGKTFYQDMGHPNVRFESAANDPLQRLLSINRACLDDFRQCRLFALLDDPVIVDENVRETLLDCLQMWSDYFQVLLHLRVALASDEEHRRVARLHLLEELGHNQNLAAQRGRHQTKAWDVVMQSSMYWFHQAMTSSTDLERTLLMHLVLECSGEAFHKRAAGTFHDLPHFCEHGAEDGAHAELGVDLLKRAPPAQLAGLENTLKSGWRMLTVLCERMADLSRDAAFK